MLHLKESSAFDSLLWRLEVSGGSCQALQHATQDHKCLRAAATGLPPLIFSKHKTLTEPRFSFPPWQVEDYISLAQRENSSTSCGFSVPKDPNSILKGLNWNPRNTWVEKMNSRFSIPNSRLTPDAHGCFLHTKQSVLPWNQLGTPDSCHLGHCQP